jgi:hypothetical protein
MRKYVILDKNWLYKKYITECLTMQQIADLCNTNRTTIFENLVKYNIPKRSRGKYKWTDEQRKQKSQWHKEHPEINRRRGKHHSIETRMKMSEMRQKEKAPNWKGGISYTTRWFRKSNDYLKWRKAVLERDNYKCQYDGCDKDTNIAHHVKPYIHFPELRLDISNGLTICEEHHKLIHKKRWPVTCV